MPVLDSSQSSEQSINPKASKQKATDGEESVAISVRERKKRILSDLPETKERLE